MATQKFMGRNQLIDRLAAQVGDRDKALAILTERGHYDPKAGKLTAEERAKDRAARASGQSASSFKYDPKTNRAARKRF